jgi:hypothetical protein
MKRNNGFVVAELLIGAFVLVMISACVAVPCVHWQKTQYEVDALTRELVMDLHFVQQSSLGNNLGVADSWSLRIRSRDYSILHNNIYVHKKRPLGNTVRLTGDKGTRLFRFDELGRPNGKDMHFTISSYEGTYKRTVVIAAQTGRIRVE